MVAVVAGCGLVDHREPIMCGSVQESIDLAETARAMTAGERVPLAELTDFEWDTVWSFSTETEPDVMQDAMGVTDLGRIPSSRPWCAFHGLYFVQGDQLVRAFNWDDRLTGIVLGYDPESWGRDVLLVREENTAVLCNPADCPA
ncbi:hypothetical protein [Cellulomonas sp. NPDC089187]|uniref:hypothetical protein n=1 Tax=Cellulomonas sp. NPDC089187 TaxID=3154970 RepID=UPI003443239A